MPLTAQMADRLIDETPRGALDLARVVSLAVRIEPELLRRARFELLPQLDVSAEADLWFSDLSEVRSTRWMVLHRPVAERLRQELARDRDLLEKSWAVLRKVHAQAAPAIVLEEEVTYLALSPGDDTSQAIERKLASVVHAIVKEQRSGLIDWAIRAIPRLPQRARDAQGASALKFLASGSASSHLMEIQRLPVDPQLTAALMQGLPPTDLWVRLISEDRKVRLEVSRHRTSGATAIKVPLTEPVIVDVIAGNEQKLLTVGSELPEWFTFHFEPEMAILMRTAAGATFRITRDWGEKKNTTVLVAGPAANLSPWLTEISRELGAMLAREGYSLVTTGGAGVEQTIAEAFAHAAGDSADKRMQHVLGPNRRAAMRVGNIVSTRTDANWLKRAVAGVNAVIVLEGGSRTRKLVEHAMGRRLPVIPVGDTGAADWLRPRAEEAWLSLELRTFNSLKYSGGDVRAQIHAISELLGLRDRMRWNLMIDDESPAL